MQTQKENDDLSKAFVEEQQLCDGCCRYKYLTNPVRSGPVLVWWGTSHLLPEHTQHDCVLSLHKHILKQQIALILSVFSRKKKKKQSHRKIFMLLPVILGSMNLKLNTCFNGYTSIQMFLVNIHWWTIAHCLSECKAVTSPLVVNHSIEILFARMKTRWVVNNWWQRVSL